MSDSYLPDNEPRDILLSLEELAAKKLPHAPTFRKAAEEITRLRADLAAVTEERDALKGIAQRYEKLHQVQLNLIDDFKSERDALAARLEPVDVDDEKLVEIVANAICVFASALPYNRTYYRGQGRAAIAAIRPHIEEAERERWQKMLARMGAGTTKTGAVNEDR